MQLKKLLLIVGFFLLFINIVNSQEDIIEKEGYKIPMYNYTQIEPLLNPDNSDNTIYVFNFWATYCAPCIKELPHFERIGKEYADKNVKIILISLDFKAQIESKVIPFLKKRGITSEVVLLSDPDANSWIDKINPSWSGAIPATLIVKGNKKEFYEQEFTYEELKSVITKFIDS